MKNDYEDDNKDAQEDVSAAPLVHSMLLRYYPRVTTLTVYIVDITKYSLYLLCN
jgi:hypothetical protein